MLADRCALVIPKEALRSIRVPNVEAGAVRALVGNNEVARLRASTIRSDRGFRDGFITTLSLTALEVSGVLPCCTWHTDIMFQAWGSSLRLPLGPLMWSRVSSRLLDAKRGDWPRMLVTEAPRKALKTKQGNLISAMQVRKLTLDTRIQDAHLWFRVRLDADDVK